MAGQPVRPDDEDCWRHGMQSTSAHTVYRRSTARPTNRIESGVHAGGAAAQHAGLLIGGMDPGGPALFGLPGAGDEAQRWFV